MHVIPWNVIYYYIILYIIYCGVLWIHKPIVLQKYEHIEIKEDSNNIYHIS